MWFFFFFFFRQTSVTRINKVFHSTGTIATYSARTKKKKNTQTHTCTNMYNTSVMRFKSIASHATRKTLGPPDVVARAPSAGQTARSIKILKRHDTVTISVRSDDDGVRTDTKRIEPVQYDRPKKKQKKNYNHKKLQESGDGRGSFFRKKTHKFNNSLPSPDPL